MKTLRLSLACLSLLIYTNSAWTQEDRLFSSSYSASQEKAKEQGKFVMLYFAGTDWCRPCIKMKKDIFEKEAFKRFSNNHLIPVIVDFPRLKKNQLPEAIKKQNLMLADQYNSSGVFPLIVFLNSDGQLVETTYFEGRNVEEYITYLTSLLKIDE